MQPQIVEHKMQKTKQDNKKERDENIWEPKDETEVGKGKRDKVNWKNAIVQYTANQCSV